MSIVIGTAGWSIPLASAEAFPAQGSALERYAARFPGAEINSSFHRPHRRSTWERWGASVPAHFRFSVKLPKTITHGLKLADCAAPLRAHLEDAGALGDKLAVHLVQLPPSLAFDAATAEPFFRGLSDASGAAIACEPRHASWFEAEVAALLAQWRVARVAADPARVEAAAHPGVGRGWSTTGSTGHRSSTGRATRMLGWRPMQTPSAARRRPPGASSTTPPRRRPRPMHWR